VNTIQRDEKREKSQQKIKTSIKKLETCLKHFYQEYEHLNNSSIMHSQTSLHEGPCTQLKSSDTSNSLETIPQLSTCRLDHE